MWWSYILAAVGLLGLWLAGSGRRLGWVIGVGAQVLWTAYAIATHQYGFIATAVAYAVVYARGARKASRVEDELADLRGNIANALGEHTRKDFGEYGGVKCCADMLDWPCETVQALTADGES